MPSTPRSSGLPNALLRTDDVLTHPVFNTHHTEHEMLRYLEVAAEQGSGARPLDDLARLLHHEAERDQRDDPGHLAGIRRHPPLRPARPGRGYHEMIGGLTEWLKTVTGFDAICMQPNSGAQGEYAGLVAIARYHQPAAAKAIATSA